MSLGFLVFLMTAGTNRPTSLSGALCLIKLLCLKKLLMPLCIAARRHLRVKPERSAALKSLEHTTCLSKRTPWSGYQSITVLTQTDKQQFTFTFILMVNLKQPVDLICTSLGENWSTHRKPMHRKAPVSHQV